MLGKSKRIKMSIVKPAIHLAPSNVKRKYHLLFFSDDNLTFLPACKCFCDHLLPAFSPLLDVNQAQQCSQLVNIVETEGPCGGRLFHCYLKVFKLCDFF